MPAKKKSAAKKSASTKGARKAPAKRSVPKGVDAVPSAPIDNPSNVANVAEPIAPQSAGPDAQPFVNPAAPVESPRPAA